MWVLWDQSAAMTAKDPLEVGLYLWVLWDLRGSLGKKLMWIVWTTCLPRKGCPEGKMLQASSALQQVQVFQTVLVKSRRLLYS